jgi:hypothetical protein
MHLLLLFEMQRKDVFVQFIIFLHFLDHINVKDSEKHNYAIDYTPVMGKRLRVKL